MDERVSGQVKFGDDPRSKSKEMVDVILENAGMTNCNPAKILMEARLHITKDEDRETVVPTEYRQLIGSLRLTYGRNGKKELTTYTESCTFSCESKFMAAVAAAQHALWLRSLVGELTGQESKEVLLRVGNVSAIALLKNLVFHKRSKYISIRFLFTRECIEQEVKVEHICGKAQRADILKTPYRE
ncbi:uncharacterized protein LOC143601984 [Bidens hawaiensis]|uniref:uncharacterized protein LOC143601984 n=1 Tax=Bidens hawaiensis TaxID=980011 RepID=UPI00404B81A4